MFPPAPLREKLASALRHRPWQGKDLALLILTLLLSVSAYAFRESLSAALAKVRPGAADGETVSVFVVGVDRQNRQFVDILFDAPSTKARSTRSLTPLPPPSSRLCELAEDWRLAQEKLPLKLISPLE